MLRYLLIGLAAVVLWSASPTRAIAQDSPRRPSGSIVTPTAGELIIPPASTAEAVTFYLVGGIVALCAIGCVLSINIVRMAMCLFGTLGAVAILYFLMAANFLGAIQLIVYVGGTLVVIVFGIMLTSTSPWVRFAPSVMEIIAGAVVCLTLFGALAAILARTDWGTPAIRESRFSVARIGESLLTTYLVPFELASVLLLAVMIGAAYLARAQKR